MNLIYKEDFNPADVELYRQVQIITPTDPTEDLLMLWFSFRYIALRQSILRGKTLTPATNWSNEIFDEAVDSLLEDTLGLKRPPMEA
ncbi:hypothetical protein Aura_00224 [Pseudomonas phage vB_PpuM-Aura]